MHSENIKWIHLKWISEHAKRKRRRKKNEKFWRWPKRAHSSRTNQTREMVNHKLNTMNVIYFRIGVLLCLVYHLNDWNRVNTSDCGNPKNKSQFKIVQSTEIHSNVLFFFFRKPKKKNETKSNQFEFCSVVCPVVVSFIVCSRKSIKILRWILDVLIN